ncbi:conserved hypothetical protein [uncultured Desulfobacterium sp.]|uniref:ATP-binding protein n=1 Tax=uncultured Desulfobacterium sp. TaxID=201089 RepID=A0A445N165_9BACT|nr:conserved hypothetical protein [uncultured Desulfobacterium sp.]
MPALSEFVTIKRRYSRSVNLERDFGIPDSLLGYIPTSRAMDSVERFLRSFAFDNSVRAWTLTGLYGTGKSAFANFLTALCSPQDDEIFKCAIQIIKQTEKSNSLQRQIKGRLPESGLIRAVVTAQREPIAKTVIRALNAGVTLYWHNRRGPRPGVISELNELYLKSQKGASIDNNHLVQVLESLAQSSWAGILLIIDELGKNLEFSAQNQSMDDLYLLQQIAEMPPNRDGFNVSIFGLLHQSFIDYAHGIASAQRNEWAKIQGRFEDIPFIESADQMVRLIGQAIDQSTEAPFKSSVNKWTKKWQSVLSDTEMSNYFSTSDLPSIFPLHPLSALILPILCTKFSQNDRTLFTFLASGEPDSFSTFLAQSNFSQEKLPVFKLHKVYDYFVESAGMSISARPQFQRWIEIQSRLSDASNLDPDVLLVLKTIGLLNLVSTAGSLRASKKTVALAMCNQPDDRDEIEYWDKKIKELLDKGFIIWRKRIDELRIWEGSDFDIEKELSEQAEVLNISLADLLNEYAPLRPLVAQKHSYNCGTLRYFERQYFDRTESFESLECKLPDSDGLICYWVGNERNLKKLDNIPHETLSGKPLIVICASELSALRIACDEYVTLRNVLKNASQLQTDGIARREVGQRVLYAQRLLNDALSRSFDIASGKVNNFDLTDKMKFSNWADFQGYLSHLCDEVYIKGPCLWNELINRRELTSQGAAARTKLLTTMLENIGQPRLGIVGNGPEYSVFESVLIQTGLYVESKDGWVFSRPPENDDGIYHVWIAIENFCKKASKEPKNISILYDLLEKPPYGSKQGIIPVLLLSVLLYQSEYVSVYQDGTFIPVLGPEHFELLVKKPERFSVKYFEMSGLRAEIFQELGKILSSDRSHVDQTFRNRTILSIVKPLVGFAQRLPKFTLLTNNWVTDEAKAVRRALLEAKEPDELLFTALPRACGLPPIVAGDDQDRNLVKRFRKKLALALSSLQAAYDDMLGDCEKLIKNSFAIRIHTAEFRENLRYRAMNLSSQVMETQMKSFILAAAGAEADNRSWLESILLIILNKTPKSWTDEDVLIFETKLSNLARRFANLEALQKEIAIPSEGIDARRITLTYPDGKEIHQMLWIDRDKQENIKQIAEQIIEKYNLNDDMILKQAVTAALIEKIFYKGGERVESQELKKERKIV